MSIMHYDFCSEYELMLSAWGDGELKESDLVSHQSIEGLFDEFRKKHDRIPDSISLNIEDPMAFGLDYGYYAVDTELLEKLVTLKELILPDSIKSIAMTPKLSGILRENNTLIRGNFGSFADKFAAKEGLRFRPSDFVFARSCFEPADERSSLKMVFARDGSVYVLEESRSPGSSAGNDFGFTWTHDLSSDFFMRQSAEQVAEQFRTSLRNNVIESGKLASFIKKARARGYYTGAN